MALYKIMVVKNSANRITFWKEKNNPKAAYDYGISEGTDIFGSVPDSVVVEEEKPVV
jgi:hypothetical protein